MTQFTVVHKASDDCHFVTRESDGQYVVWFGDTYKGEYRCMLTAIMRCDLSAERWLAVCGEGVAA